MSDSRLRLKFFGVRGSIPTPVADNLRFGGNTTCLEVRSAEGDQIVIDAGSGARSLGIERMVRGEPDVDFWMTHFHSDHIQGLPFFAPLFVQGSRIRFHSPKPADTVRDYIYRPMQVPYFPGFDSMASSREFVEIGFEAAKKGSITIHPFPLCHPQDACGYRVESGGAVIVHASDHEHGNPQLDATLREYAQNADVLILDAQYTPEEHETRKGWGHSTWLEATRVALDANVKHLVLFHHDPGRSDGALEALVQKARELFPNTDAAREGWSIRV